MEIAFYSNLYFSTLFLGGGSSVLITGHHLNDQIETFLLRFARSSGITGLKCITASSFLQYPIPRSSIKTPLFHSVQVIRPLLDFSKSQLYHVCQDRGISWIEDPSNLLEKYDRNRVRKVSICLRLLSLNLTNELLKFPLEFFFFFLNSQSSTPFFFLYCFFFFLVIS